jgi:hypothetical protein
MLCRSCRSGRLSHWGRYTWRPAALKPFQAIQKIFFFPLYFFRDFIHIICSIHPGCHPGLGPTSLSGNSCSWVGGGEVTGWESNPGLEINSHQVRIEPWTGLQQSSVLTTELRRTPNLSYAAPHKIEHTAPKDGITEFEKIGGRERLNVVFM